MTFRPTVLRSTPNRELRWLGRFIMPGIFDGEHYFIIEPLADSNVRFIQGEKFTGMLVPFLKSSLDRKTKAGFMAVNEALKRKAERSSK
jgi:hypothetical protein